MQPDAPDEIIQSSYRTLMQKLNAHPDLGGDHAEAALINRAYAVLSDPRHRADYDRKLIHESDPPARRGKQTAVSQGEQFCPFCASGHPFGSDPPSDAFCAVCQSPLCPADRQRLEQRGQRKIARITKKTSLVFFTQWPQLRPHAGTTNNMSTHGMMFETSRKISVESVLKIDCTQFQSIAHVENCRHTGNIFRPCWQIGVSFVTLRFRSSRGVFVRNVV